MIAIAGTDLPQELLSATGRYVGPLALDPGRETSRSERWLESKFAPWARYVLEAWAEGEYDHIAQVLFSRADDTSQRLYYYLCELQRRGLVGGPEPLILDVAKIPRAASLAHTVAKVRSLAEKWGVADEALEGAIAEANSRRVADSAGRVGRTCLLVGTPPPDKRLHEAIQGAGFAAVGQTLAEEWTALGASVAARSGDPCAAVGRWLHSREGGPRSFADPAVTLTTAIAAVRADAVVLWRIEEDEAQTWHLPAERAALERAGVPHLVLTRRNWLGCDGVVPEIAGFLKGVAT